MRLELRGITKRFPGVLANDHIDLDVGEGEIHALLGENGAGKTTLMNVLYGLYRADEGEILIDGRRVEFESPRDAIEAGIGMVHQHFMLVPVFTVTENVMLGVEETSRFGFLERGAAARRVREISERFGLEVDPDAMVEDLSVGAEQRVEIVKALYRDAELLILDEPTAVLTPQETEEMFSVMKSLTDSGKSIIFITHKLGEVMAVADRITVLRSGAVVGTARPQETSTEELASMMVGRDVQFTVDKGPAKPRGIVLELEDVVVADDRGQVAVEGISLEVQAGEVVGVAGVQGNGQTELVEAITGLRPVESGRVLVEGAEVTHASPRQVFLAGVGHIPEDRVGDGLIADFSVADNLVLNSYYLPPYARRSVRDDRVINETAQERVRTFDVRTPSIHVPVGNLSGGNQQKVIVAREFSRPIKLLVAAQPTRGLDVGSIQYIHEQIIRERDQGAGVLLVSTELDEVLSLADRVAVMYRGRILAVVDPKEVGRDQIGLMMAGSVVPEEAGP